MLEDSLIRLPRKGATLSMLSVGAAGFNSDSSLLSVGQACGCPPDTQSPLLKSPLLHVEMAWEVARGIILQFSDLFLLIPFSMAQFTLDVAL